MKNKKIMFFLPLLCLLLVFLPAFSFANSFNGLGVIVFGMILGIPSGVVLIILIIISAIFLNSPNVSAQAKHIYKIIGICLSFIAIFLYPIVGGIAESRGLFLVLLFSLPLLILGIISLVLLFKLP